MALADTVPTLSASNRGHTLKRLMTGAGYDISQIAWYTSNIKRRPFVKHLHLDGQVSVGQSAKLPARALKRHYNQLCETYEVRVVGRKVEVHSFSLVRKVKRSGKWIDTRN